ncbi:MAG: ABC transporter ATP-binding protein [Bacteroidia bacterium]
MEPAIKVEHISKKYVLKHEANESYTTLRDSLVGGVRSLFTSPGSLLKRRSEEEFWALKDINFEIQQGDRVGIIGRNGAGKSTLLKVLSRIVAPTSGRVEINGRVASLLEVGTGFHPELSGRENVFLNGSILGMSKEEIKRKFDEIIAFAEVERFLDTPVKRYSSGMYVRLAFAVAAHLEPEILIVDEVLAVGDATFQKKCLGKMREVSGSGRTIIFVSHNMAAIQNLCDKCIYLKNGQLVQEGKTDEVIPAYLRASSDIKLIDLSERTDRSGNGAVKFVSFDIKDRGDRSLAVAHCGDYVKLKIGIQQLQKNCTNYSVAVGIDDEYGQRVTHFSNEVTDEVFERLSDDSRFIDLEIPKLPLKSGQYTFTLYSTVNGELADWIQEAGTFAVEAGDYYRTGKLPPEGQGAIYVEHSFKLSH